MLTSHVCVRDSLLSGVLDTTQERGDCNSQVCVVLCAPPGSRRSSVALHGINPEAPHVHASLTGPVPESKNVRLSQVADGFSIGCSLKVRHRAGLSYGSLYLFSQPPVSARVFSSILNTRQLALREAQ